MGIDYNTNLGYGFLLSDEVAYNMNEGTLNLDRKLFDIECAGNAYHDDTMQTFVFVKASAHSSWSGAKHKNPLQPESLTIQNDWNGLLLEEAKRLGVTNPKIGWWLLCSVT
jgi:hypothetical protein